MDVCTKTKLNNSVEIFYFFLNPLFYVKDFFVSLKKMQAYVKFVEIPAMCIGFDKIIRDVKGLSILKYILVKNMIIYGTALP